MPKNKKKSDTSDSDSGPEDITPVKKSKSDSKYESKSDSKSKSSKSKDEEISWSLGKNRFIRLTEFKSTWYVDIREHYNADGDLRPGKKGIMLTMEQWQKMKGIISEIDEAIKQNI